MTKKGIALHAAIGGALGLCVGILMGMTTAPIIGTVVGALAALFATVFGVKDQDLSAFSRIGGFGVFCVLGVVTGIYVRAHNSLGISVGQQVAEWVNAGFDSSTARQIVVYRELGILQDTNGLMTATERAKKIPVSGTGSLLSAHGEEECRQTNPTQFGGDAAKTLRSYRNIGGQWEVLARSVETVPVERQSAIINSAWALACPGVK